MNLDEIFRIKGSEVEISEWYHTTGEAGMWYQLIELLFSRFENLQKQIDELKKSAVRLPDVSTFKVGWVYRNREDKEILILKKEEKEDEYPLKGVSLTHAWNTSSYISDGSYRKDRGQAHCDLIVSTGRKWEIEE